MLNNDLIALKLVLDEMEVKLCLEKFADRLKLQKATYLIQLSGIDLGYRFSWYLRGPYSSELARDLFELHYLEKKHRDIFKKYSFSPDITPLIDISKGLLKKPNDVKLSAELWYELLASLHYLKHIVYIPNIKQRTFKSLYRALPSDKRRRFSEEEARVGWNFLKQHNLIRKKELTTK